MFCEYINRSRLQYHVSDLSTDSSVWGQSGDPRTGITNHISISVKVNHNLIHVINLETSFSPIVTSVKRLLIRGLTSVWIKDEECIVMLHHRKLADINPANRCTVTTSERNSSKQTRCQQSKAAHVINMNQCQANQNHIP